jgi:hypothetical protein
MLSPALSPSPQRRPARRWAVAALLALVCAAPLLANPAAPLPQDELKAQILFRSLMFIEWPAAKLGPGQALALCLLDEGALANALQALAGRSVNGHALELRRGRIEQLGDCHAALVGPAFDAARAQIEGRSLLLVSEAPAMLDKGVMLSLQIEDGRIVFDVGLEAARRAGLEVNSKLLRLARFVRKG